MNLMEKYLKKQNARHGSQEPSQKSVFVYSRILDDVLLIVADDQEAAALRTEGATKPIYRQEEIPRLKGLSPESLKAIHSIKRVFPEAKVEDGGKP